MTLLRNFHSAEVDWRYDATNLKINGQYVQDVAYMDQIFDHIKQVGFDTISLATNVPINVKSGIVSTVTQSGDDRSLPVNTWKVVDLAQSKGLNVLLKLYICDVENDAQIRATTPLATAFNSNFSSKNFFETITAYEKNIAIEAQKHGVDGIYVGVEQTGFDTKQYYNEWKNLISEIRSVFNGSILYSGHYDASSVAIYDLVDIASISVFYEWLSDKRSTDINTIINLYKNTHNIMFPEKQWNVIESIREISSTFKKPILLDNLGFFAANEALHNIDIWSKTIGGESMDGLKADYELQIARYNAFLNLVSNYLAKEVTGINFEQYMPWVDALVAEYDRGNTDIWQKQYAQFARLGFSLNHQSPTEKYISDFIKEPWGFKTYFPGTSQSEDVSGTKYNDYFVGSEGSDSIRGGLGNDFFLFGNNTTTFDGGSGIDRIKVEAMKNNFNIVQQGESSFRIHELGSENYVSTSNTERVTFSGNNVIALDVQGNAGQAYRLYQAALDRTPDERGLAGWIKFMDEGGSLNTMAQSFIDSQEFRTKYGALDDRGFVNQLYLNVLDRNGEASGINGWVNGLANGLTRADVLKGFSESGENQANVLDQIKNGIPYTEWWLS